MKRWCRCFSWNKRQPIARQSGLLLAISAYWLLFSNVFVALVHGMNVGRFYFGQPPLLKLNGVWIKILIWFRLDRENLFDLSRALIEKAFLYRIYVSSTSRAVNIFLKLLKMDVGCNAFLYDGRLSGLDWIVVFDAPGLLVIN